MYNKQNTCHSIRQNAQKACNTTQKNVGVNILKFTLMGYMVKLLNVQPMIIIIIICSTRQKELKEQANSFKKKSP